MHLKCIRVKNKFSVCVVLLKKDFGPSGSKSVLEPVKLVHVLFYKTFMMVNIKEDAGQLMTLPCKNLSI